MIIQGGFKKNTAYFIYGSNWTLERLELFIRSTGIFFSLVFIYLFIFLFALLICLVVVRRFVECFLYFFFMFILFALQGVWRMVPLYKCRCRWCFSFIYFIYIQYILFFSFIYLLNNYRDKIFIDKEIESLPLMMTATIFLLLLQLFYQPFMFNCLLSFSNHA